VSIAAEYLLGQYATMNLATIMPRSGLEWLSLATIVMYFVGVGGTDIWLIRRITQYIRDKHPEASTRLGASMRLIFFMRSTRSLGLHDPELDRMFDFKKRFDNVTGVLFIVILGALLLLHRATR
jgi:hypothetical protein